MRACARTHGVRIAGDLLVGGRDDEVRGVHGDQVGGELAAEVVLVLQLLPAVQVQGRVQACFQRPLSPASSELHKPRRQGALAAQTVTGSGAGAAPLRGARQYTSASAYLRAGRQHRIRPCSARPVVPIKPGQVPGACREEARERMQTGRDSACERAHADRKRQRMRESARRQEEACASGRRTWSSPARARSCTWSR